MADSLVDGLALRRLRELRGLSREALGKQLGVDQRTVARWERREVDPRKAMIDRLCSALKTDEDTLAGRKPLASEEPKPEDVRLGFRVSAAARNAYTLVARRYEVDEGDLAELAPLMFALLAEASLHWRRARLERLTQALQTFEREIKSSHLEDLDFADGRYSSYALGDEEESLAKHDIFGQMITDVHGRGLRKNPFMLFLNYLIAKSNGLVEPLSDDEDFPPLSYCVCRTEVNSLLDGQEDAVHEVLVGWALLHEMPKELLEKGTPAERAAWIRERAEPARAESERSLEELLNPIARG
jgi:transcriptional regulator with XRE-family HTH domain